VLKLQKWQRVTHEETGISCEVGRLTYSQKPLLAAMIADVFGVMAELRDEKGKAKGGVTLTQTTDSLRDAIGKLDGDMIERLFEHRVRNVEGLETEDGVVKTGAELLELADQDILMWVIGEIAKHSNLSAKQGKASASPSTSLPETTPASDSPAESTESADGPSPSTAEETPTESASSSRVA
jgi:hypothetical protein